MRKVWVWREPLSRKFPRKTYYVTILDTEAARKLADLVLSMKDVVKLRERVGLDEWLITVTARDRDVTWFIKEVRYLDRVEYLCETITFTH